MNIMDLRDITSVMDSQQAIKVSVFLHWQEQSGQDCSSSKMVLQITKHTTIYPGSGPS
jgi:hypothetical protein